MDLTTYLAQIWGPVILAVGIGFFASRAQYLKIYRSLGDNALAALTFGMFAMTFGIIQVSVQNDWTTLSSGIVSFLGWALLAKGAAFVIFPAFADRAAQKFGKAKLVPFAGGLALAAGAYLSYVGYFA
jgi:hypothetical protein